MSDRRPSGRVAVRSLSSIPGQLSRNRAIAAGRTASIHTGPAVTRKLPARPARASTIFSSAATISRRTWRTRSAATVPRA